MNKRCNLSSNARNYINDFKKILEDMISGMTNAELTDSISHNFIVQMIPHHCAAIEMSKNVLKYTTNITLEKIASNIITEQTRSIENMQEIKNKCSLLCNSQQDLYNYNQCFEQITNIMFTKMSNSLITNNININFISEMVPHHKGAIRMSNNALKYDICQDLKPILHEIIKSQREGVKKMQSLFNSINKCNF